MATVTITDRDRPGRRRVSINFGTETLVEQSHAEHCTPAAIVARYKKTGFIPMPTKPPRFGDFTNAQDFMEVNLRVKAAQDDFERLDPKVRLRFGNDPAQLLAYINNPENRSECVRMGLLPPEVSTDPSDSFEPPAAATAAEQGDGGSEATQTDASG